MHCTLCGNVTVFFIEYKERHFHKCNHCGSVLLDTKHYLVFDDEKYRYDKHSDDIEDEGYQQFVSPIVNAVLQNYTSLDKGLDYGCGKTAIIKTLLQRKQYTIAGYDPIYYPNQELLSENYNYITCCEVVEHFYNPEQEFKKLMQLLLPGGKLYLKTNLYSDIIDFKSWWYKNDPTHVIFYTKKSMEFIEYTFGFSTLTFHKNLIEFSK